MPEGHAQSMRSHLDHCEDCRLEFHRLRYAVGTQEELALDRGMLAQIQTAIEQWEHAAPTTSRTGEPLKHRVETEIAPYLGSDAARSILQTVADSGENLLSRVEPVLALFLGGRAAARLVNHVVDAALLRA